MTLDLYQNFISAQYLENIWIEFHQKKLHWQCLGWDYNLSFHQFLNKLWPLIDFLTT